MDGPVDGQVEESPESERKDKLKEQSSVANVETKDADVNGGVKPTATTTATNEDANTDANVDSTTTKKTTEDPSPREDGDSSPFKSPPMAFKLPAALPKISKPGGEIVKAKLGPVEKDKMTEGKEKEEVAKDGGDDKKVTKEVDNASSGLKKKPHVTALTPAQKVRTIIIVLKWEYLNYTWTQNRA